MCKAVRLIWSHQCVHRFEDRAQRGQSGSLQCWPEVKPQAMHTFWNTRGSLQISRNTRSLKGDQALAKVDMGGSGLLSLQIFKTPSRHGPGQLVLSGPAWAREGWTRQPPEAPPHLNHSVILSCRHMDTQPSCMGLVWKAQRAHEGQWLTKKLLWATRAVTCWHSI